MKMMLWKELRENAKWGLLALLALAAAELYTLAAPRQQYSEDYNNLTICSPAFLLTTAFGCSAIGVALALVQILPELRRDQWAALLHRPVPRGTIFFGKAIAGLLLYAAATVPPFFICVAYVAMPGQFDAPLLPGMLIPGLSDLFLGPVFYFATLLICLHRGSWWGSRAAIGLSVAPILVEHLIAGWPFLLPILAALVYLAAARGAMLSNGSLPSRSFAARLALPVVILFGAETAILLVFAGLEFLPQKTTPNLSPPYLNFHVSADGQVYLISSTSDGSQIVTDSQGNALPPQQAEQLLSRNGLEILPFAWIRPPGELRSPYLDLPRSAGKYLQTYEQVAGKEIWYLLRQQNYFVGYDKLSRRVVAICDADGFKPPGAVPRPFPQPLQQSLFSYRQPYAFWTDGQVYLFDFAERNVTSLGVGQEPIVGASPIVPNYLTDKPLFIAVAQAHGIHFYGDNNAQVLALAYPHDPAIWSQIWLGASDNGDRIYLESQSTFPWFTSKKPTGTLPPVFLDVFDAQGHLVATYQHPDNSVTTVPEKWTDQLGLYLSPFLPAAVGTVWFNLFSSPGSGVVDASYFTVPRPELMGVAPASLLILFGLDALLGLAALVWAKRNGFATARALRWAVFTACFGLPGLITFRLAADWPARVRCPICGSKRPLHTEDCPGCHQAWPAPPSTGLEIFEEEKVAAFAGAPDYRQR
jgi:ABC-type transport system involved in multi-copper enzyme maturation permease subunit